MSDLPHSSIPLYLWFENPLIEPDREFIKDQRICSVDNPSIIPFWPSENTANGTAVLIFPGGGYSRLAINHEGYDIARWFTARGIAAFVVKYRLSEYGFPAALLDGLRAVRLLRKNAEAWNIDSSRIGVVGFSAGGHVAASISLRPTFVDTQYDLLSEIDACPNFSILGYPVIALEGPHSHAGSRKALMGENPDPRLLYENSLHFQLNGCVPPMFIFHGVGDQAVPVANSINFFAELQKYNKQSELHIYQTSIHGVGMIQGQGPVSAWPQALELWLQQNQFLPVSL